VSFVSGVSQRSQPILGLTSAYASANKKPNLHTNFQQAIKQMIKELKWMKWVPAISRLPMSLFLNIELN
jgi:hypothetical protein